MQFSAQTLDKAPLHSPFTLIRVDAPQETVARLTAHGLRKGALISMVQNLASGARVVSVGGGRLALGRDVLAGLTVEAVA